jgi:radical SAM protein with 4Fe4S-binding SPASM domain
MDKNKLKESKTFCMAPWMTSHTWPDGKVFACCTWDTSEVIGNINDNTLEEIWNSDNYKKIRKDMLSETPIKSCERCYKMDNNGDMTYRNRMNEYLEDNFKYVEETHDDGFSPNYNLHLWDFRISNFCNFKCRSCGLELSSSWYNDTKEMGQLNGHQSALINVNDKSSFMDMLLPHYKCVEEVYFAGGEPLMMPEHYQIMDKLIELGRTDVTLRYSTNFSILKFKDSHVFDYWKQFPNLELLISVDGVKEIGEYVRKGFKHDVFVKNVNDFINSGIKYKNLGYVVTYGALNYLHMFDLILNFIENGFLGNGIGDIYFSPIYDPKHYDCSYLPKKIKDEFKIRMSSFRKELSEYKVSENFTNSIMDKLKMIYDTSNQNNYSFEYMDSCRDITMKLDKIRKEKIMDIFPYFKSYDDFTNNQIKTM